VPDKRSHGGFDRLPGVVILELPGSGNRARSGAAGVVNLIDEAWKSAVTSSKTFSVFMKLSALALSYGLPRRLIEPTSP
jgi:hypothetical protein